MISLIDFKEDLIIPKEEAQELELTYEEIPRIGIYQNQVQKMRSYDFYKEDCLNIDGKYYEKNENNEKVLPGRVIERYCIFSKYVGDVEYVYVKKDMHLVRLKQFAPACKHIFLVKKTILA